MERYLRRLETELRGMGLEAPVFLMLSGGGLATMDTACRFPIRMVESGPAGGAIFAAEVARQCELPRVVSFDMGGTTAKICLVDDYRPQTARSCEVARVGRFKKGSGLALRIPVIEMVEIGAGGGSLAHVDGMGRIAVGPESAGADPGPACYGRGGVNAAVTDANLVLGRYDPATFAGGTLRVEDGRGAHGAGGRRRSRSRVSITDMAALGIVEIVDENMANAARVHAIESGKTFDERTLIAFGGGGPVHATPHRREGRHQPRDRAVWAPVSAAPSASCARRSATRWCAASTSAWARSISQPSTPCSAKWCRRPRRSWRRAAPGVPLTQSRIAYMRYVGQGHEIPVPLPDRELGAADVADHPRAPMRPNMPSSTTGWCRAPMSRC